MLNETLDVELLQVNPLTIHSSAYYDITFKPIGHANTNAQTVRINPESFYSDPQVGDTVRITMIMGNIFSAERLSPAAS